ncbi:hypothetical protein ILYODFUR_007119 [Ilyodon furcidens]|uniref:Uncharacterized protein n=1 Tax=Ilyodon furcidens TaxID=33524 RepID=A0ABV0TT33_9TELE
MGVTGRCCGAAVAHQRAINLGSKGVEIQKEASARCLTSVEMFLPDFLWAECLLPCSDEYGNSSLKEPWP